MSGGQPVQSIEKKIHNLEIPRDVKMKACDLYSFIQDSKRRRDQRTKYLCFCVHQAYIELGMIPPDSCRIAEMFEISSSTASAAIAKRPPFSVGIVLKSSTIKLPDMIRFHAEKTLGLPEEYVTTMVDDFQRLLEFDKGLKNDQSKPLIAAFILCYANQNSLKIDIDKLAAAFYLESSTIKGRCCKIQKSYIEMLQT